MNQDHTSVYSVISVLYSNPIPATMSNPFDVIWPDARSKGDCIWTSPSDASNVYSKESSMVELSEEFKEFLRQSHAFRKQRDTEK